MGVSMAYPIFRSKSHFLLALSDYIISYQNSMKRLLTFCFLLFFISQLNAQISVSSFNELPMSLDARVHFPKKDQDGNICAIIKVVTTQNGFLFDCGTSGVVATVPKPSEIWVYVPYGVKRMTISHPVFGLLRNYEFKVPIEKAKVYELVLVVGQVTTIVTPLASVWLTLRSTPDGADAYVDDVLKGTTPRPVKLLPGKHTYRIEKALYHPENGEIVITGQEKDGKKDFPVTLKPAFGTIKFSTQPELGATVLVDGEETGKTTPFSMKIKSGTHSITIKKENYQPKSFELTIKDGDTFERTEKLSSNAANVTITAQNDADIYIDDKYVAKGSYQGVISAGVVTFEAKKEGYYSDKKEKDIAIGETAAIDLSPKPIVGSAEVLSEPIDATVFLNGVEKGTTPLPLKNLMVGKYELRLEKEGYYGSISNLTITENKTTEVNEKLQSNQPTVAPPVTSKVTAEQKKEPVIKEPAKTVDKPIEKPADKPMYNADYYKYKKSKNIWLVSGLVSCSSIFLFTNQRQDIESQYHNGEISNDDFVEGTSSADKLVGTAIALTGICTVGFIVKAIKQNKAKWQSLRLNMQPLNHGAALSLVYKF